MSGDSTVYVAFSSSTTGGYAAKSAFSVGFQIGHFTVAQNVGSLQVSLAPPTAVAYGAQWRIDGGALHASGSTVRNLLVGNHTLGFSAVSGFSTPAKQTVTIYQNQVARTFGSYYDTSRPKLRVNFPTTNLYVSVPQITATGQASDNVAVSGVLYQLNGTGWLTAATGDNWTDWNANLTLNKGPNTLQAYAIDTSGNMSATTRVQVVFVPSATLTLLTKGRGNISPADNGKLLALGTNYSLTAIPSKNWLFSNWMGGASQPYTVLSAKPVYTFKMQSNLVLQASFVTNMFLAAQGVYNGLFAAANVPRDQTNSGYFGFSLATNGTASGKFVFAAESNSWTGKFGLDGSLSLSIRRTNKPALTGQLLLDFADQVTGALTNGAAPLQLVGDRDVFGAKNPATKFAGSYTLVIPGTNDPESGSLGASYGVVNVDTLGNITFNGSLADGTPVSRSALISKDGYWPFYLPLYSGMGSLWSWNLFTNHQIMAMPAASWINATNKTATAVNRSGFTNNDAMVIGALFNPKARPLFGVTNGEVVLEFGNLPFPITNAIAIASNGAITVAKKQTNHLSLTINTNGVVGGAFTNPAPPHKTVKVNGVLLQSQSTAAGYFLGTNQSGSFLLH